MTNPARQFGIDTAEYEAKRDVFEMCQWLNKRYAEMNKEEDFETIYVERRGLNVKKLLEEATPAACLALSFFRPFNTVAEQCFAGNQPFDAILDVTNGSGNMTS